MITNPAMGIAIAWFDKNSGVQQTPCSAWRKARNDWLKAQGVCGIIKEGSKSRSFPPYWEETAQFWCDDEIDEQIFSDKWSKE